MPVSDIKDQLDFQEVSGDPPPMVCHCCGKLTPPKCMAVLHPFEDESSEISIPTCSDECKKSLLSFPELCVAIVCMADEIGEKMGETLRPEWQEYIDEIIQK